MEREKVIEGLRICFIQKDCDGCPYQKELKAILDKPHNDDWRCPILDDALALLQEQEAKKGKWIEQEDYNLDTYYDCSVCGESWSTVEGTPWENGMNYCPHCGARMESIICDS